jgi:hypothetical protein
VHVNLCGFRRGADEFLNVPHARQVCFDDAKQGGRQQDVMLAEQMSLMVRFAIS